MVSCSRETVAGKGNLSPVPDAEVTTLRATIGPYRCEELGEETDHATRTSIVTDGNGNMQLVWSDKDTLGIFPSSGFQVPFPLAGHAGEKNATFDGGGWGLKSDGFYSAYTPLIGDFYLNPTRIPLSLLHQSQDGNGSFEHLNKYDFMTSLHATVNPGGGLEFNFQHLVSILHIQIKMPTGGKYKYVLLETNGAFTTEATLDLTDGSVTTTSQSPVQLIKLENVELDDSEPEPVLDLYVSLFPVDLSGKTLYIKVYNEDGLCFSTTLAAKNFEAGTVYHSRKIAALDVTHTGLPVVVINTPGNQEITSKEEYIGNTLISVFRSDIPDEFSAVTNIKGRGNYTWQALKKPYAVKFDKKKSLVSLPEDKSWILLANYYDPTLLRNDVALYLGDAFSTLDWTPHFTDVDLVLNGEYRGIYQLGEKIKIGKKRVNVGDDGFLVEIDMKSYNFNEGRFDDDARCFFVPHILCPINVKDPDVEYDDTNFTFIRDRLTEIDAVLFSDNYQDPQTGWQKYMDMDSFVDWYIINELAKNVDSAFLTSCFMHLKRNGKLVMGPIWDFDLGFGNYGDSSYNETSGFYIKDVTWYERLFTDPAFVARVKERFQFYYTNRQLLYDRIDRKAGVLKTKVYEDNYLWGTLCYVYAPREEVMAAYQEQVDELKDWLEARFEWLNTNLAALQ